jgi:molecular chaperone DnaK (HSP70)
LIGFDLGNTFFKVTLVKPGSPFSIVENMTSKRKTDTMLTIANDMRLWSSDSFNNAGKYPKSTFSNPYTWLGFEYDEPALAELREKQYVMNDFVADDRGYVAWQTFSIENKEETVTLYTEEILAMIFKYGRELAERQVNG